MYASYASRRVAYKHETTCDPQRILRPETAVGGHPSHDVSTPELPISPIRDMLAARLRVLALGVRQTPNVACVSFLWCYVSIEQYLNNLEFDGARLRLVSEFRAGAGSRVWLGDLHAVADNSLKRVIVKAVTGSLASTSDRGEFARHAQAYQSTPVLFREKHLVRLLHPPLKAEGHTILVYELAGSSARDNAPLQYSSNKHDLEVRLTRIWLDLIVGLNSDLRFGPPARPIDLLGTWMGYRMGRLDQVGDELLGGIDRCDRGELRIGRELLPNPIAFLRHEEWWTESSAVTPILGRVHGDLHGGNLLVKVFPVSPEQYWIIDLSTWQSGVPLMFDHTYLELSELIRLGDFLDISEWTELCRSMHGVGHVSARAEGLVDLFQGVRRAFRDTLEDRISRDVIEDLTLLSSIATGVNFALKQTADPGVNQRGLIYAACALERVMTRAQIPSRPGVAEFKDPSMAAERLAEAIDAKDALGPISDNEVYVLVTSRLDRKDVESVARINWSFVFDLDADTADHGLYSICEPLLSTRRSTHLVTFDEKPTANPLRSCTWLAARGLRDRPGTQSSGKWADWRRAHYPRLLDVCKALASTSAGATVTVVVTSNEADYAGVVLDALDANLADRARYVLVEESVDLEPSLTRFGASPTLTTIDSLLAYFSTLGTASVSSSSTLTIPGRDGTLVPLDSKDLAWIGEDVLLLHSGIGTEEEAERESGQDFYRGLEISWFELSLNLDVPREIQSTFNRDARHGGNDLSLTAQVRSDLRDHQITQINLFHHPGSGGTTASRRLAWDVRLEFPVVLLNRITPGTADRIRRVYQVSSSPVLVIGDEGTVSGDAFRDLYLQLRGDNTPCTMVIAARRTSPPPRGERNFFLPATLSRPQAAAFVEAYAAYSPSRSTELERFMDESDSGHWMPFYFGLLAFRENFVRLDSFIADRLEGASEPQRQILGLLAMSYHYGQKSLPGLAFKPLLGLPARSKPDMTLVLSPEQLDLGLPDDHGWRPTHELVAEHVMQRILSGIAADDIRVWRSALSLWSKRLVKLISDTRGPAGVDEYLVECMRRLFVERESERAMAADTRTYSRLISDLPSNEARAEVFETLTDAFPGEPHFWAHRGRLLAGALRRFEDAEACLKQALILDDNDNVLYHIQGMILRARTYQLMDEPRDQELTEDEKRAVSAHLDEALQAFAQARKLDRRDEHPYVSAIELLVRYVRFGVDQSGQRGAAEYLATEAGRIYRERLQDAEDLLAEVRRVREGSISSRYVDAIDPRLDQLYGDYSRAIQRWTNLLDAHPQGLYRPPVRRSIVHAYLGKRNRQWSELTEGECERIRELMEDNLEEEPGDDRNVRLWFLAAKRSPSVSLDLAVERLTYWAERTNSLDANYYLYSVRTLQALDGDPLASAAAEQRLARCKELARGLTNRTASFEWLGLQTGLRRLVHAADVGEFDPARGFFPDASKLARVTGRIAVIRGPEAGEIELGTGQKAFFVPVRGKGTTFERNRSENALVNFYLGFSYDGLRAWEVAAA